MRPQTYNPHSMIRNFRENFKAEAKICSKDEYNNLTPSQNSQIHELKLRNGWLDGRTPPPGFQINPHTGRIEPNSQMVSAIRAATSNTSYDNNTHNQSRVRFAYVEEFLIGRTVTAMGFSSSLGKLENSAYAHLLYAYDHDDGSVLLIEHNNTIYLGDTMQDSLSNPMQSEEISIRIDLRPRHYYDENCQAQTITFPNGMVLPILYEGVMPYVPVRRPILFEIENSTRLVLTSRDDRDPYHLQNWWAIVNSHPSSHTLYTDADPISIELMSCRISERAISHQLLHTICNSKTNINQECNFPAIKRLLSGRVIH